MVHNRTNKRITYLMDGCDKRIFMVSGCGKPFQTHEDEETNRKNISGHITYTSNPKIPRRWKCFQIKYPLVSTHIIDTFVDGDGFSSL